MKNAILYLLLFSGIVTYAQEKSIVNDTINLDKVI